MWSCCNLDCKAVVDIVGDDVAYATTAEFWEELLFFELIEPEEIAYIYKIKPAKDFGVTLVRENLLICFVF